MPCYEPLHGWRAKRKNENGKRPIVFRLQDAYKDMPVTLPCGKCEGCQLEKARQWSLRCLHESSLYDENCFITLTYNDENLPEHGSLCVRHFQLFMKRLRKRYADRKIRFFHCGEYGAKRKRPHYHALLFNFDFPDKEFWRFNDLNQTIWRSKTLEELWPFGFSEIGEVNANSAGYVARYCTKKVYGDESLEAYSEIDYETGEILSEIAPEYITMSRRPGIGREWYEKYKSDCYPKDFVTVDGTKHMLPKYYDGLYELESPSDMRKIKAKRELSFAERSDDLTPERLEARREVKKAQLKMLRREYERQ